MFQRITDTVKHLLIINVVIFIATKLFTHIDWQGILSLHFIENPVFKPWHFFTYMFNHGNEMHLFGNMLGLFFLGPTLEQMWGKQRFLFFYVSVGIFAGLISMGIDFVQFKLLSSEFIALKDQSQLSTFLREGRYETINTLSNEKLGYLFRLYNSPLLGASGAIFGLMVAFAYYFPETKFYVYFVIPVKTKYLVPSLVAADFLLMLYTKTTYTSMGIGFTAHVAGAVIGFIMAKYWKQDQFRVL